jgi:hypothetical protein
VLDHSHTELLITMSKDYKNAKRVKLATNYNQSHINKWDEYRNSMGILNRKTTLEDLADFAEVLLGENKVSTNNYLSTIVNYEIDEERMEECSFFERRYSKIRNKVKKIVADSDPEQAAVFALSDVISLSPEDRKTLNFCTLLGWRFATLKLITYCDLIMNDRDTICVRCPMNGKNTSFKGAYVPVICNCVTSVANRCCVLHGPGLPALPMGADIKGVLSRCGARRLGNPRGDYRCTD